MKKTRLIGILAFTTLFMSTVFAQSRERIERGDSARTRSIRTGEVIVRLSPEAKIAHLNGRQGTRTLEQIPGTDYYLLELPEGAKTSDRLKRLSDEPGIIEAAPNFSYRAPEVLQTSQAFIDQTSQAFIDQTSQAFIDSNVPVSFTRQLAVSSLHITEAQRFSMGAGVKVAVIDTGIDLNHPLFRGRIEYPVYDFVGDDGNPSEEPGAGYGHGTFIAGLIALTAPRATIMPVRAFSGDGTGTSFTIARAIRFAADNGARVINMSFGLLEEDGIVKAAINYASRRAYLVAAAGNDDENLIHFPASSDSLTMSVTSTGAGDIKATFSNFHYDIDVSAPGVDVYSAYPDGRWAFWSGSSFSTGLVSGEAALLLSLRPNASRSELDHVISSSGRNIDGLNQKYIGKLGRVRVDFEEAVESLLKRND